MIRHDNIPTEALRSSIRKKQIMYAGNIAAKIYGTLGCSSGKAMKKANRIFFKNIDEALHAGYRPCGKCLRGEYKEWKRRTVSRQSI